MAKARETLESIAEVRGAGTALLDPLCVYLLGWSAYSRIHSTVDLPSQELHDRRQAGCAADPTTDPAERDCMCDALVFRVDPSRASCCSSRARER